MEEQLKTERAEFAEQIASEEARIASQAQQCAAERAQLEQERLDVARREAALAQQAGAPKTAKVTPAASHVEEEVVHGPRRFAWTIPVVTIAMLVVLIVVGALITRRRATPRTVTIGRSTIVPTRSESAAGTLPRGGFLNQGSVINRDPPIRLDSVVQA